MAFGIDDAALATILGGVISTAGALYTNKKNLDANDKANLMNWQIARENNATQIAMANSAHQREVADLRMAGLNPILSAGGNGSSTPTLSGATMNPIQQSNAFEGLANSAKGLSRYLSLEYKNKLANQAAGIENVISSTDLVKQQATAQDLDNKLNRMNMLPARLQNMNDVSDAYTDMMESRVRFDAAQQELGLKIDTDNAGVPYTRVTDPSSYLDAVNLEREGLRSDMKTRSNANWRANLSSFVPFVSPAAINSARNATRATVPAYRRGHQ